MIDDLLGPELMALRDDYEAFARRELGGGAAPPDRALWAALARQGLFRLAAPQSHGGRDGDVLPLTVAIEALAAGSPDPGLVYAATAHIAGAVLTLGQFASPRQLQRFYEPLLDGRAIGAQAITEPEAGSDISRLGCRAQRDGDGYIIDGQKLYCSNGPVAAIIIVYCTVDESRGVFGQSAFIVPAGAAGLTVEPMPQLGLAGCPLGRLNLAGCRVPGELRLGEDGQGSVIFKRSITAERVLMMAGAVGAMRRQLDAVAARARERRQFGQAIGRFQSVANRVVDMKLRYEASRLMLYRAARHRRPSRAMDLDAAMAKLYISEGFLASSLDAVQVFGGAGCTTERELGEDLLQAVASRIYAGTSEVQRLIIARFLGL